MESPTDPGGHTAGACGATIGPAPCRLRAGGRIGGCRVGAFARPTPCGRAGVGAPRGGPLAWASAQECEQIRCGGGTGSVAPRAIPLACVPARAEQHPFAPRIRGGGRRPQISERVSPMAEHLAETPQPGDAELVAACARGDARSWRVLVNRYRRLVYGIPRALGLQPADAEEVFQHTFAELVRALPHLRDGNRLAGWLATTAQRGSLRVRRGDRRAERG